MKSPDTHRDHAERTVLELLDRLGEPELDRTFICGAVVERHGSHFRISAGAETDAELAHSELRSRGRCGCGAPLSYSFRRHFCRRCS